MDSTLETEIEKAIKLFVKTSTYNVRPDAAVQYTQAALNLALVVKELKQQQK